MNSELGNGLMNFKDIRYRPVLLRVLFHRLDGSNINRWLVCDRMRFRLPDGRRTRVRGWGYPWLGRRLLVVGQELPRRV